MGSRLEREQVVGSRCACPLKDSASSEGNWPDEVLRRQMDTLMKLVTTALERFFVYANENVTAC